MRDVGTSRSDPGSGEARVRVGRDSLSRSALEVAPDLLGAMVVSTALDGAVAIRLTEVEAYEGADDPGSHGYRGRTPRNEVMFGRAGHLYVYFTYGMHWCANVVCGPKGEASAVLLRAGEVVHGLDLARSRRPTARADRDLARGPARLASALGLTKAHNGVDLCAAESRLALLIPCSRPSLRGTHPPKDGAQPIETGPRVGLAKAADRPWRFWLADEPTVSPYRPHLPRRRSGSVSTR